MAEEGYVRHILDAVQALAYALEEDIPALEEEDTPDAASRVLETEETEDEFGPQREDSLQAFLPLQH